MIPRTVLVSLSLFISLAALYPAAAAPAAAPPWPDPVRLEAEVRAIELADSTAAANEAAPRTGRVVALGSSSIRFWHDTIARDLSPIPIVKHGFGGSTMHDAVVYADRLVLPLEPFAVLLYEGDNDIEAGVSPERVRDEFVTLVRKVRARQPECRFYVLSIKPSPARRKWWPAARQANVLLRLACKAESLCTYVDVATAMLDRASGRPRPELYLADSLHMTPKGYEVWRKIVRPALFRGVLYDLGEEGMPGVIPGRMFEAPDSDSEAMPRHRWVDPPPSNIQPDSIPGGPRIGALGGVDGERPSPARVGREERGLGRDVGVDRARDLLEQRGAAADLLHVDRIGDAP
jgi:lysophospholipase L1-like esterase